MIFQNSVNILAKDCDLSEKCRDLDKDGDLSEQYRQFDQKW